MTTYQERLAAGDFDPPGGHTLRPRAFRSEDTGAAESAPPPFNGPDLDRMTKEELLAHAQNLGITPANASMSKGDLRTAVDTYYEAAD